MKFSEIAGFDLDCCSVLHDLVDDKSLFHADVSTQLKEKKIYKRKKSTVKQMRTLADDDGQM